MSNPVTLPPAQQSISRALIDASLALQRAHHLAEDAKCDVAAQLLYRAQVLIGSAIKELAKPTVVAAEVETGR